MKIDNFTPSEKIFEKRIAIEDEKKDGFGPDLWTVIMNIVQ